MPRSRRALLAGTATAAAGALAGCSRPSSDERPRVGAAADDAWPTRYGNRRQTAASAGSDVADEPTRQWPETDFPQYDSGVFAASGGAFVVDTNTVSAVAADGSVRWREAGYYGPPLLTSAGVVVSAMDGGLVALDRASGERRWTTDDAEPRVLAGGRVVGSGDAGALAAITPGDGAAWTRRERHAERLAAVASDGDTVVAAFAYQHEPRGDDGRRTRSTLVAYRADSGGEQWRFGVPGLVERLAVRDGRAYAGVGIRGLGSLLYAVSLSDGRAESQRAFDDGWFDGLAVLDGRAVAAAGSRLVGFDARLGAADWEAPLPARASSLAASASLVYATWSADRDAGTTVAAFRAADGETQWQRTLPPDWGYVAGVASGRLFVAGRGESGLYALG